MRYADWREAALKSHARIAVSPAQQGPTPRGILGRVIVISDRGNFHYAYASAHGIRIPETHGRPTAAEVDRVREWEPG